MARLSCALVKELGISSTLLSKWRKEFSEYGSASFQERGVERLTDEQYRNTLLTAEEVEVEFEIF